MSGIKKSITELVGKTPLLELTNYEKKNNLGGEVIIKLEYNNPNQSVKDRAALGLIQDKEKSGELVPGKTIVDITSGNTGIAEAAYAAAKGYKYRVYIQDTVSKERFQVIRAFGGEAIRISDVPGVAKVLEESHNDFFAALNFVKTEVIEKDPNLVFVDQIGNPANPEFHYHTTGPEIWEDTDGEVAIFVAGVGTGGTLSGVGKYLKEKNPNVKIVGVQPGPNSLPKPDGTQPENEITGVHPFDETIPKEYIPANLDQSIYDEIIAVEALDAYATVREVAKTDGVLLGESSGATIYAAAQLAKRPENKGKKIVALAADTGLRYLSTGLFD